MIVGKNLSLKSIYEFAGHHLYWLTAWMLLVTTLYHVTHWKFITIPWLPLSLIGTAVAFYVGFKNNQAYDRLWEARKIWGAITNNSRKLSTIIKHYRADGAISDYREDIRKEIIFRHIAYLYQLRAQLLEPAPWEHTSLPKSSLVGRFNRRRRDKINTHYKEELDEIAHQNYLSAEEKTGLQGYNNKAVQLLDKQTQLVQYLYETN